MLMMEDSATLTIDELTWLSASTLIENHYALVETPSSEQDIQVQLHTAFPDTKSENGMEAQVEDEGSANSLHADDPPLHPRSALATMLTTPPHVRANMHAGMTSTTPGSGWPTRPITRGTAGTAASLQFHRNPITSPPTPPHHHLHSKYPSHDYSATRPPSPTLSTSTLSSNGNSRPPQTEWIYRRPKSSSPANHALLSRHRSASASCSSPSRSPSLSYTQHRSSGPRQHHAHAIPRPSSPVLISSTSQLVESVSRSPSVCSSGNGLSRAANASVSSLQLQSSIRVSPLKNRTRGASASSLPNESPSGSPTPPSLERCPSNTSTMTSVSAGTAIWSILRAKSSGQTSERSRALKSIPSHSQTITDPPTTPTFVAPSSSPLPIFTASLLPPRIPPKDRFVSGTPLPQHKDKDRLRQRRDKFASAPPIPILGPGAANPSSSLMVTSVSPASPSRASGSTIRTSKNRDPRGRTPSLTSECSITTSTTTHTSATTNTISSSSSSRSHPDTPPTPLSVGAAPEIYNCSSANSSPAYLHGLDKSHHTSRSIISETTAAAARSQAYAQLTARLRRPSTSPSQSSVRSFVNTRGQGGWRGYGGGESPNAHIPLLTSYPPPPALSQRAASSKSFSHTLSPSTPHTSHSILPKTKSILTRTSSMSTKGSQCGGTTKSVKFVEIPEVHYRSGCYEDDDEGNDDGYSYGDEESRGPDAYHDDGDEDDESIAVGARGEGQEGIVLRECMGIDVEAIDMDIETYLGIGLQDDNKELKLDFRRKQGTAFSVGKLLSIGSKRGKDKSKEKEGEGESKECIAPIPRKEQKKEKEKEKPTGLGLKRLMSLATRKTAPPPLSISIGPPIPLGTKPATASEDIDTTTTSKKRTTSPPVSPTSTNRPTISGPYTLGSYPIQHPSGSRSSAPYSPLPSPSASLLQHSISPRTNPKTSSNTSLNRLNSLSRRQYNPRCRDTTFVSNPHNKPPSLREYRTNLSTTTTTANGKDVNTQRPVGPNIARTRPKGIVGSEVPSFDVAPIPLTSTPSYESFRSTKSYGNRSMRSIDVGSIKSAGVGSIRNFKTWMSSRVGGGVSVAVAE